MPSPQSLATRWFVKNVIAPVLNIEIPVSHQRARLNFISSMMPLPWGVSTRRLKIRDQSALWIDVNAKTQRTVLYLHGGAYSIGSIDSHKEFAARLGIEAKANVLLLDYRLAPEHPFPAGLDDAVMAYRWLLMQGYDAANIVIAGDSAGGGLALATAMKLRDENVALPACLCMISPWTDLTMSGDTVRSHATTDIMLNTEWLRLMAHHYAGPDGLANPLASPLFGRYSGLPPMVVHASADEILLSDSQRMANNARKAGVDVTLELGKGVWHIWHVHAGYMPESKAALKKLGRFIQAKVKQQGN